LTQISPVLKALAHGSRAALLARIQNNFALKHPASAGGSRTSALLSPPRKTWMWIWSGEPGVSADHGIVRDTLTANPHPGGRSRAFCSG